MTHLEAIQTIQINNIVLLILVFYYMLCIPIDKNKKEEK